VKYIGSIGDGIDGINYGYVFLLFSADQRTVKLKNKQNKNILLPVVDLLCSLCLLLVLISILFLVLSLVLFSVLCFLPFFSLFSVCVFQCPVFSSLPLYLPLQCTYPPLKLIPSPPIYFSFFFSSNLSGYYYFYIFLFFFLSGSE